MKVFFKDLDKAPSDSPEKGGEKDAQTKRQISPLSIGCKPNIS